MAWPIISTGKRKPLYGAAAVDGVMPQVSHILVLMVSAEDKLDNTVNSA
jgi:hypothetical protein